MGGDCRFRFGRMQVLDEKKTKKNNVVFAVCWQKYNVSRAERTLFAMRALFRLFSITRLTKVGCSDHLASRRSASSVCVKKGLCTVYIDVLGGAGESVGWVGVSKGGVRGKRVCSLRASWLSLEQT